MKGNLVSIIVPVYNSEETLSRCLDSLLKQSYTHLEVIVIDDGSNDSSLAMAYTYKERDDRIQILKTEHIGPNGARGKGVERASGDYVIFVDSDDYLDRDAVRMLINTFASVSDIDIIRFNGVHELTGELVCNSGSTVAREQLDRSDALMLLFTTYKLNSLCLQAYKKRLFEGDNVFSAKVCYGEDFLANLEIYKKVKRVLFINDVLYYYCSNNKSTTRNRNFFRSIRNVFDRGYVSFRAIKESRLLIRDRKKRRIIAHKQIKMVGSVVKTVAVRMLEKRGAKC